VGDEAVNILHKGDTRIMTDDGNVKYINEWDPWEIPPEEFKLGAKIGSGITAEVFHGIWRGTAVAVKQIKLGGSKVNPKIVEAFKRELIVMVRCRHPNLVLFMGASTISPPIRLISEYCEGGTLFDILHNRPEIELCWKQKIKILLDVAKGMNYLHHCKPSIVHRDLKSLNLLLAEKVEDEFDTPIVKIADFGMSKIKENVDNTAMTANAGTYHWMAPEVLDGNSYNEKVDVYSYGIVMFEVVCRAIPYEESGLDAIKIAVAVSKGRRPNLDYIPKSCPENLISMMKECWDADPNKRPTMDLIIEKLRTIRPTRPSLTSPINDPISHKL
jgi:serine/threonine protein kinase